MPAQARSLVIDGPRMGSQFGASFRSGGPLRRAAFRLNRLLQSVRMECRTYIRYQAGAEAAAAVGCVTGPCSTFPAKASLAATTRSKSGSAISSAAA